MLRPCYFVRSCYVRITLLDDVAYVLLCQTIRRRTVNALFFLEFFCAYITFFLASEIEAKKNGTRSKPQLFATSAVFFPNEPCGSWAVYPPTAGHVHIRLFYVTRVWLPALLELHIHTHTHIYAWLGHIYIYTHTHVCISCVPCMYIYVWPRMLYTD